MRSVFFLLHFLVSSSLCLATSWNSEFAFASVEEGKINPFYFVTKITCDRKNCTWLQVTLNQCVAGKFFPKLEQFSTENGTLVVAGSAMNWEFIPAFGARFKIQFSCENQKCLNRKVVGISGLLKKYSSLTNSEIYLNYVKLPGKKDGYSFDCPIDIPY